MQTEKILVTGGAGFIGTNLVKELKERGHEVDSIDLLNASNDNYIRADVSKYRQLELAIDKKRYDYVFHLAAEYGRWNGEDHYEQLWETNVVGTKNIIRLQEKNDFRMVFFSSSEVYGDYSGIMKEDVMENNPIKDTYQMNDYAMSKWVGELMCINSATMFGTETVRVRPVNCYGPGEHYTPYRGFIPKFIYHSLFKIPITVFSGHRRIIDYVGDTVNTLANICDNFIPGEAYNLGGKPEWDMTIDQYAKIIFDTVGIDDSIVTWKESEPFTTGIKMTDSTKAERHLNHMQTVDPKEGIKRTVDWMKWYYRRE